MKVALIQTNGQADKSANLAQARSLIEQVCAEEKPDFIALPEVFTYLGSDRDGRLAAADALPDGETPTMLRDLAVHYDVIIHGGSLIERDGDRLFNTTVVYGPDGSELARYRKMHLFDVDTPDGRSYRESDVYGRGDAVVTYDVGGITVGCTICYDLRFPEVFRALMDRGAQIVVVPSVFTLMTGKDHWEVLLRARAIETGSYVLAPAQWGTHGSGGRASYGHSMVVDPWGHVIARARDSVGYITARLDMDYLHMVRAMLPVARHRVL